MWRLPLQTIPSANRSSSSLSPLKICKLPDAPAKLKRLSAGRRRMNVGPRSEMIAQVAKTLQNEQPSGPAAHFFVFQGPGGRMRDKHRIQAGFERGVDVTARAVAHHP